MKKPRNSPPHTVDIYPVKINHVATFFMVVAATVFCFFSACFNYMNAEGGHPAPLIWAGSGIVLSIFAGIPLIFRARKPALVYYLCAILSMVMPWNSLVPAMALPAYLISRPHKEKWWEACLMFLSVCTLNLVKELSRSPDYSLLLSVATSISTKYMIVVGAIFGTVEAFFMLLIACSVAFNAQSKAISDHAEKAIAQEVSENAQLHEALLTQQTADAIAAQTHDTLAHSLSLIALNATNIDILARNLHEDNENSHPLDASFRQKLSQISHLSQMIRAQAAGALDETHAIIDILHHPESASTFFSEQEEKPWLSYDRLTGLFNELRASGITVESWLDITDAEKLDTRVSTQVYQILQEALTNALRHNDSAVIQVHVNASPSHGIHVNIDNTFNQASPSLLSQGGNGLESIEKRAHQCGGNARWEKEDGWFRLRVFVPWASGTIE